MNVQLTIDFNAVAYCQYFYENRRCDTRRILPRYPTVNGSPLPKEKIALPNNTTDTALAVATRRGLLDVWTAVCILQFRNSHSMRFTGDKAKQIKQTYDKHIYNKKS